MDMYNRNGNNNPAMMQNKIASAATRLKPMPNNVARILRAINNSNASAIMIADLISLDQVLTAEVLKVSNSALLGYSRDCATINEGVVRLGLERVKIIVLGVGAADTLSHALKGYRLGGGDLWRHSVTVATLALWFAQVFGISEPDVVYVAGLLHDIGKLLLDQYMMQDYERIISMMQTPGARLWEVEEKLFGINHAVAGGMIASQWNFPAALVEAIQYHHHPGLAQDFPRIAALVNVANAFSPNDTDQADRFGGRFLHPSACEILNTSEEKLQQLHSKCMQSMKLGKAG